jgi:hypothetical protein
MNYLSHFVFNHDVCGLPVEPYFAIGVVLPDLWLRFSQGKRIRWKAVRAAQPAAARDQNLRAGLLNHVEVDRRFHSLPVFLRWQGGLKASANADGTHPALVDFLAHMAIELVLDHHLLLARPALADEFYGVVSACDPASVAERVGILGAVDTAGLDEVIRQFITRRFLRHYRTHAGLADVVRIVLSLARIPAPPDRLVDDLLWRATQMVMPRAVWEAMPISVAAAKHSACGTDPTDGAGAAR